MNSRILCALALTGISVGAVTADASAHQPSPGAAMLLKADGLGDTAFGTPAVTAIANLEALYRSAPATRKLTPTICGIDRQAGWPGLTMYFFKNRFVGYSARRNDSFSTAGGLTAGDSVAKARRLYRGDFRTSLAQGGSYTLTTRAGRLSGFLSQSPPINATSRIRTIEAGQLGCAAARP